MAASTDIETSSIKSSERVLARKVNRTVRMMNQAKATMGNRTRYLPT